MKPIVKVIACTRFFGDVPYELCQNEGFNSEKFLTQDKGSTCARLIECAGRTCYDSYGTGRTSEAFHNHIKEVGHGSVLEHASISFYVDNVSRGLTHELVRHRVGVAISQRSTRYVDEAESPWVLHPLITHYLYNDTGCTEIGQAIMHSRHAYQTLVDTLQAILLKNGVDKLTARKQARGAARGLLGNALRTSMVWTGNIRAIRNVIEQRASDAADAEIRLFANALFAESKVVCPEYFDDYVCTPASDGIGYTITTNYRKL